MLKFPRRSKTEPTSPFGRFMSDFYLCPIFKKTQRTNETDIRTAEINHPSSRSSADGIICHHIYDRLCKSSNIKLLWQEEIYYKDMDKAS